MNAVVFGGQGFIGAQVVHTLLSKEMRVIVADISATQRRCDDLFGTGMVTAKAVSILDRPAVEAVTRNADRVYHLAGVLGTSELDDDVHKGIEVNIVGAVNVFSACVENNVPIVFYPSKPNVWLNTYTITKFAAEQFARLYGTNSATKICSLRYYNAYGPYQACGPVRKIIPSFAQQALRGLAIEIFGNGTQVVDMIFCTDLARITVAYSEVSRHGEPLDCGRGVGMTVNEIADVVNAYYGNRAGVRHLPMRRGETPDTQLVADIEPIKSLLGGLQFTDWESSLALTLRWYTTQDAHSMQAAG